MNNEYNIGLIQVWDDEEMEFYQADLTLIYPDDTDKKYISIKVYDENGNYIQTISYYTIFDDFKLDFRVKSKAESYTCELYFCELKTELDTYTIICNTNQIDLISCFKNKMEV